MPGQVLSAVKTVDDIRRMSPAGTGGLRSLCPRQRAQARLLMTTSSRRQPHPSHPDPDDYEGPAWPTGKYPVPVLAAAVLAAEGVSFLLVGSAALWLHGQPIPVADADIVVEPDLRDLGRLSEARPRIC